MFPMRQPSPEIPGEGAQETFEKPPLRLVEQSERSERLLHVHRTVLSLALFREMHQRVFQPNPPEIELTADYKDVASRLTDPQVDALSTALDILDRRMLKVGKKLKLIGRVNAIEYPDMTNMSDDEILALLEKGPTTDYLAMDQWQLLKSYPATYKAETLEEAIEAQPSIVWGEVTYLSDVVTSIERQEHGRYTEPWKAYEAYRQTVARDVPGDAYLRPWHNLKPAHYPTKSEIQALLEQDGHGIQETT